MRIEIVRQMESAILQLFARCDWRLAAGSAIGAGAVFRLVQYLSNRSLWLDEILVAKNIFSRSFLELVFPLSDNQGAPIVFLWLEKLAVQWWGATEYALRFFPLVSGIGSIVLFFLVARCFLNRWTVVLALILFATAEPLIYYSSEVKQYAFDVFFPLGVTYVASRNHSLGASRLNVFLLGVVGILATWSSDPAVFVLAGVASSLLLVFLRQRDRAKVYLLSGVVLFWGVSFALNYMVRLNGLSGDRVLLTYWKDYFIPFPPLSLGDIKWYANALSGSASFLFPGSSILLIAIVLGAGLTVAWSEHVFGLLVVPLFLVSLASGLHYYPFYQRFLLFGLPALLLLCAMGVERLCRLVSDRKAKASVAIVLVGLLLFPPVARSLYLLVKPQAREESRPVIEYMLTHREKTDALYVYFGAKDALDYYLSRQESVVPYTVGVPSRDNWMGYLDDLAQWQGRGRVWFLFSHVLRDEGVDDEKLCLQYLARIGRLQDSFSRSGASVYLYDFR